MAMTLHPLIKLAMKEPALIASHLSAYAKLAGEEAGKASSSLALQAGLYAGAGVLALLGLVFTGVALLLVAATDAVDRSAIGLVAVPLVPFLIAGVMVLVARGKKITTGLDVLKAQIAADVALVREMSSS